MLKNNNYIGQSLKGLKREPEVRLVIGGNFMKQVLLTRALEGGLSTGRNLRRHIHGK